MPRSRVIIFLILLIIALPPRLLWASEPVVWVDTSRWETVDVLVKDGYWKETEKKVWIDTSSPVIQGYWATGEHRVWVPRSVTVQYQEREWVDTSAWVDVNRWIDQPYMVWINSGYYKNVWVSSGYHHIITSDVWISSGYYVIHSYTEWETREDPGWAINKEYPIHGSGGYAVLKTRHERVWVDTSHFKTVKKKVWVDTSHWEVRYVDTSRWETRYKLVKVTDRIWVPGGYWRNVTRYKELPYGHWETRYGRHWVDTSYIQGQGYWHTFIVNEWIDTSYYDQQKVWITDGYYASPLKGTVTIEKTPRYVFTRWHKDGKGKEASMELRIRWKVDNEDLPEGEAKKEIIRINVYQDVIRYGGRGKEKVTIFNGSVKRSEEGFIDTVTRFEHSGSDESMLHIYLYSQTGQVGHVKISNPINGFRSINIKDDGAGPNHSIWLGGWSYETLYF
jgi:hypothetical protein